MREHSSVRLYECICVFRAYLCALLWSSVGASAHISKIETALSAFPFVSLFPKTQKKIVFFLAA